MKKLALTLLVLFGATCCPAVRAADLDACGNLSAGIPGTSCSELVLHVQSVGYFVLDTYSSFGAGDVVHVVGSFPPFCWAPCPEADGCLIVGTIEPCAPTSAASCSWGTIKSIYR
jgi:hypothetical protein